MSPEKAQRIAERILDLSEVEGCGIVDRKEGKIVVYLGDFLELDWKLTDTWGSLAVVAGDKLKHKMNYCVARYHAFKIVIFFVEDVYIGTKISREEPGWKVAAKLEPIIQAMS